MGAILEQIADLLGVDQEELIARRARSQFERIVQPDPKAKYPICLEGERAGPPDTCGGVPGYEYILEMLADPSHDEYQDVLDWAGYIDPEHFDPKRATARMTKGLRL